MVINICAKCREYIKEPHLLCADGKLWHEDCLRCTCCDVRLAELDKVCYVKANMPLCRRDYLRLYGRTGHCSSCQKRILAFEFVMRIQEEVYHLNCFCCQQCQMRFCVGDRFYMQQKTVLCEKDYFNVTAYGNQDRSKHLPVSGCQGTLLYTQDVQYSRAASISIKWKKVCTEKPTFPQTSVKLSTQAEHHQQLTSDDHSSGYDSPTSENI